jgi:hypothetical protein
MKQQRLFSEEAGRCENVADSACDPNQQFERGSRHSGSMRQHAAKLVSTAFATQLDVGFYQAHQDFAIVWNYILP